MSTSSNDWAEHWKSTLGFVPLSMERLADMNPELAETRTRTREWLFTERPDGLSTAMKELIMIVIDVIMNQRSGAIAHLQAARRAGLTETQLVETLTQLHLILGSNSWGHVGQELWDAMSREPDAVDAELAHVKAVKL